MIQNIFLDTNIFEENNFFHSNDIQGLFYYSRIGLIKLFMTSISKHEIIERMQKRLEEVKEEHNQLINSLNKPKSRILKNLIHYESLSKSQIKVSESLRELSRKLDTIIETSKINIIPTNNVDIDEVFNLYYSQKPPFSNRKEKKYEFPDAFIIKSLDEWCKTNKKKMIVVSKDNDFNDYKSSHLYFRKEISNLLQQISSYYDSKQKNQIIPKISKSLESNKNAILTLIESELEKYVVLDIDYERVTDYYRLAPTFKEFKITTIKPDYAEVTYIIDVGYSFTVIPTLLDLEKTIFEETIRPKKSTGILTIPCDLEINLKNTDKIQLKWINQKDLMRIRI
jgi:hypothetical protein